ncbi:MAG: hypothetical protein AAGU27_09800 [Dehalobacterium sp.]
MNSYLAASLGILLMACYVVFGGVWGTGLVGMVKLLLVYLTVILSGILAFFLLGGASGLGETFPNFPWFSLFGRGLGKDLSAGFSLVVGVLSTQTYIQAVIAGKDLKSSRRGALFSTGLMLKLRCLGHTVRAVISDSVGELWQPLNIDSLIVGILVSVFIMSIGNVKISKSY